MHWHARVYISHLGLDPAQSQVVIACPFHPDAGTRSFSISLDKGVFYCHGACSEPKGGGAADFLVKWAVKNGQTLTRAQASRQLTRVFSLPDAKTLLREQQKEDVRRFVHYGLPLFASRAHVFERLLERLGAQASASPTSSQCAVLARVGLDLAWADYAFSTCLAATRRLTVEAVTLFQYYVKHGLWDRVAAIDAQAAHAAYWTARRGLARAHSPVRSIQRTPITWPDSPSSTTTTRRRSSVPNSSPIRQPITVLPPTRTPIRVRTPVR